MNSILKGRMNRATYWMLLGLVVALFALLISFAKKPPGIVEFVVIVLGVPRLHDIGRSGWWITILLGFEVVSVALAFFFLPLNLLLTVGGGVVFVMLIAMIVLGCIPGDAGRNAFGEPPAAGLSFGRTSA